MCVMKTDAIWAGMMMVQHTDDDDDDDDEGE